MTIQKCGRATATRMTRPRAQAICETNQGARGQAYRGIPQKKNELTFAGAATTYMRTRNPTKRDRRYISLLLEFFGTRKISEIDQNLTLEACARLYLNTAALTINRAVFTPIISITNLAKHPHQLTRLEGHDWKVPVETPKDKE